ncbi:MAG: aminoacyl-tRNA hydrolase [Thermaerobacter sp.]|nr:aminoacyl-tRNA hydrolase [Thermaerobacter sp.]
MSVGPRLIVGLGNPGLEYHGTRHNVGFRVLDVFAHLDHLSFRRSPYQGYMARRGSGAAEIYLLKPTTFMNLSGRSVRAAMRDLRLEPADVLIVCDDLDLPAGRMRLRSEGSAGGHNGLKSVIAEIGSDAFARLRVGIGRPPDDDVVRFVLGAPRGDEARQLHWAVENAVACLQTAIESGVAEAMNQFNGRSAPA